MTTKVKTASPTLESVHETTTDLHRLGFIDKRKMRNYKQVRALTASARAAWHERPGKAGKGARA